MASFVRRNQISDGDLKRLTRNLDDGYRNFEGGDLSLPNVGKRIAAGASASTGAHREGEKPTSEEVYEGNRKE